MRRFSSSRSKGFSLLEMAVVLVIAGLMIGLVNRTQDAGVSGAAAGDSSSCYIQTQKQLAVISDAMTAFQNKNQRLPIPAGRSLGSTNVKFGNETVLPADLANIDRVGALLFGALPFQALGLSESYSADCWGNKFTYVVTEANTSATVVNSCSSSSGGGAITLKSGTSTILGDASASTGIVYAVISHGQSGVGAVKKNYSNASHAWCSVGTALDTENCDISNNVLVTANFNDGNNAGAAFYDDLMVFAGKTATSATIVPTIYGWGANWYGAVGNGSGDHQSRPVKTLLPGNAVPAAIYTGVSLSCALDTTGNAYCWGLNGDGGGGTLGNDVMASQSPTPPNYSFTPVNVTMPAGVKFTKIAVGHRHACALAANGKIYCWGDNADGQRGDGAVNIAWAKPTDPVTMPAGVSRFTDVVSRDNVNCALGDDSKAYCWGRGANWRQVEGANTNSRSQPYGITMPAGITFSAIGGTYTSMCALGSDRNVYCWGTSVNKQFGSNAAANGGPLLSFTGPVAKLRSGTGMICAIKDNNETWCWGDDGYTSGGISPTKLTMPAGVSYFKDIAMGSGHQCAIADTGTVYCKGKNPNGELGNGTNNESNGTWVQPDFRGFGITDISQIAGYDGNYLVIGTIKPCGLLCWGKDTVGQSSGNAPDGNPTHTISGNFTAVDVGTTITCALNTSGARQCWGQWSDYYSWGAPPASETGPYIDLSLAKGQAVCMRNPNQSVHCLQDPHANFGYNEAPDMVTGPFIQVSEGYVHGCGLQTNGDVQCWGLNSENEAPATRTGPYTKIDAGYYHTCGLKPNGDVDCWGRNWDGQAPGITTGPFVAVSAGHWHTCALRTNGNVKCWGKNDNGEAPTSDVIGPFTEVGAAYDHTCAVRTNGNVKCWGNNADGQAPTTDLTGPVYNLAAGQGHNCAIRYTP